MLLILIWKKQKFFGPSQIYTALSRIKHYDKLFGTGKYKKSSIKVNVDELNENERLSKIDTNTVSDDTLTIFILDVRDVRS